MHRKRSPISLAAVVLVIMLAGCAPIKAPPEPIAQTIAPSFDVDTYAIYSQFVDSWGLRSIANIAIDARTPSTAGATCVDASGEHASQIREAVNEYLRSVATRATIEDHFSTTSGVHVADATEVAAIQLERETKRAPAVPYLGTLSTVGFSRDRQVAFVYGGYWCGNLCGAWNGGLYAKDGATWRPLPGKITCFTVS